MSSRRSSESGDSVDSEVILEAERLELERLGLKELEIALSKPVAFSVRTNVSFDASVFGSDAPSPTNVISFEAKEFLHIKRRFNPLWWIGRRVRIGSPLGFIPSPAKLEAIHSPALATSQTTPYLSPLSPEFSGSPQFNSSGHGNKPGANQEPNLNRGVLHGDGEVHGPTVVANRQVQSESPPPEELMNSPDEDEENADYGQNFGTSPPENVPQGGGKKTQQQQQLQQTQSGTKRKVFSKKSELVAPYEIVPCMRPVVFVGPALKGYEVTDMMQKAIFDAMKKHFDGRIIVSRVSTNISLAKRVGALLHLDKKNVTERARSRQLVTLLEVQQDLERIFHLGSKMQLLLLDCDTINHPSQIAKTCLAPIIIYIKIGSIRVLNKLIKNRGKLQKKNAGVQTAAAEKLLQCPTEAFEYIVDQNTLSAATEGLCRFLEGYWAATHPPVYMSKAERLLGSVAVDLSEPDSDRPLVPMTPGHPGLSVVTKSALDAGFTSQEIIALTGARVTGWLTETGGQNAENELGLTGFHHGGGGAVGGGIPGGSLSSEYNAVVALNSPGRPEVEGDQNGEGGGDSSNGLTLSSNLSRQCSQIQRKVKLHVGAAQAAAMAAIAAGLTPKPRPVDPALVPSERELFHTNSTNLATQVAHPGLAMGIGMGLASGVAATIGTALLHGGGHSSNHGQNHGPVAKMPAPSPTVTAAAAATLRPPPLKDLGIHQVQGSDGTHVYQSRSARQARQRQAELERVRREAEAKAMALQATVGGRRRRHAHERRHRNPEAARDGQGGYETSSSLERNHISLPSYGSNVGQQRTNIHRSEEDFEDHYGAGNEDFVPGGNYPGTGPTVMGMSRACPPDDF
ncbi:unnamed protein product [Calicophoron daubneyi]|uniref:Guanylate kinase/L-type calcium channel beta subunit domain-containing protein n=1 Tax=Calicophoron daubneyi TaxID=300641 RepID=A0AAV2TXE2_CALDB